MLELPATAPLPRWVCALTLVQGVAAAALSTLAFFN
jgi:hypothetical protein